MEVGGLLGNLLRSLLSVLFFEEREPVIHTHSPFLLRRCVPLIQYCVVRRYLTDVLLLAWLLVGHVVDTSGLDTLWFSGSVLVGD